MTDGTMAHRASEHREERRYDGRVAVDQRNTLWCPDDLRPVFTRNSRIRQTVLDLKAELILRRSI